MRKLVFAITVLLMLALSGCGASAEDVLAQYDDYKPIDTAANQAGIMLGKVDLLGDAYIINVRASNPYINQDEGNAGVLAGRLQVFNAEDPAEALEFFPFTATTTTTVTGVSSSQEFSPGVRLPKNTKAKYALIYCEGVREDEAADLATPPLFFIVQLDKKNPEVLTNVPRLAGDLLVP